jgi:hypothetical protein
VSLSQEEGAVGLPTDLCASAPARLDHPRVADMHPQVTDRPAMMGGDATPILPLWRRPAWFDVGRHLLNPGTALPWLVLCPLRDSAGLLDVHSWVHSAHQPGFHLAITAVCTFPCPAICVTIAQRRALRHQNPYTRRLLLPVK